ncbi:MULTISPECIES: imidazoleglycerol-phosphate dehydratase HisB [Corynebacterium]|uniref:Imidazoleglycerol-phosphate dehydratase n=1 Tax=Corynebacterium glucuronolyticum TaxID=39791 RepID=A0A7T4EDQ1_9CORY|nr:MULTISPECIES: imidazoleglycerol-phosphate dehydratase HisB [Corynebacterium]EEI26779.1 imidazoleglycerol-phosphate dehydratase [Corynebacterium glucuronolyticum ATCC 51867]MCT1441188.1 imidazoleglycerol-phosphate dehydratase HisB [Corynebacterium glucuronolyticum]MCT1562234.1 imidazoleglycerol-phosphate dehydratase HisB [Corynebacterium glucuronolyticum]OFO43759.1 imidazoleglycerol-phosphate dehydratase [Corynebacterium sp. HMSC073D01]QQB45456.1 imidazoleglycerol-phosphate dehydratase HisB 
MPDMSFSTRERPDNAAAKDRIARVERATKETTIAVEINLDGSGKSDIQTGVPFFDHMLQAFANHSLIDVSIHASGDTEIDCHHTVEDTAIVLGQAINDALGDKRGITRFGSASVPMDETLCEAVVDLSGRPYFVMRGEPDNILTSIIGGHYATVINQHFFETLSYHARINLHLICHHGRDPHHITEAEFKAVARAIRAAATKDPRQAGVPSTKGAL